MKYLKITAIMLITLIFLTIMGGCSRNGKETSGQKAATMNEEIKTYTAFMAVPGHVLTNNNRMWNKIAEKIGAKAEVNWLNGQQTASERIGVMIARGAYPDFIDGSDGTSALLEAGAFIPLDEYIDDYPNIKDYLSEQVWNQLRQKDGHIYYIPQFGIVQGENMATQHSDEAFWIQKRVLEWADYPQPKTLDEYFKLIEDYIAANPETDGQKNIGFEILCDDWRYFCLENPPQFLAGYPNDGCAIVDPETKEARIYDTIPEAKLYYQKLCEEYNKGIIDPETFTMSYEQYLGKLSSGCVLGMVDQYWEFQNVDNSLASQGMDDRTYVPLGIVADASIADAYRSQNGFNVSNGLGISVSCKNVEGALKFINDLLEPEIMNLRFWGEEGVDYEIDEEGVFYRTEEQRANAIDVNSYYGNLCDYMYFPHYEGMMADGKNTVSPGNQPGEFYATLSDIDQRILNAYGYQKWTDFLTLADEDQPWFPLYSATNNWMPNTPYGIAKLNMEEVKRKWLPKVIISSENEFEENWEAYMDEYHSKVDIEAYESELTAEVARRIAAARGEPNVF